MSTTSKAIIVVIAVVALFGGALAMGEYNARRGERDRARQQVRIYERMMRTIQPLTDRQHQALDRLGRTEERRLRELCGDEGWMYFSGCP